MSKFQQVMTKEIVDCQTGELITTEIAKTYTVKVNSDSFYMTFIEYLAPLFKLRTETAKNVLIYLCSIMNYDSNRVDLPLAAKKELIEKLQISTSSFDRAIVKLKKLKLISGEGGRYMINPQIMWKGSLATRSQLLKDSTLRITFSIE